MVEKKHGQFCSNLVPLVEISVLTASELNEYLDLKETVFIKNFDINILMDDKNFQDDHVSMMEDLIAMVRVVCDCINQLSLMKLDVTDEIKDNAQSVNLIDMLTDKELVYYDEITREVRMMTEATQYPVEGSSLNVANGAKIESMLNEVLARMSEKTT